MNEIREELNRRIDEKFKAIEQNPEVHLEGLIWAQPITYWDYILPDALLNLQVQRTTQPDEMVFIMYHQINELLFKMILWEIRQVSENDQVDAAFFTEKLTRISRYFDMLSSSFSIMGDGMEKEQYMKFRNTLTPASGFQSAQYRHIEFASTDWINLVDRRFRENFERDAQAEKVYEHLYWQAAGKDHSTGKKNTLITLFEARYKNAFLDKIKYYEGRNLWARFRQLPAEVKNKPELVKAMRHYDKTVNITWVMAHYHAAAKYLGTAEATGGSDWRKYMLPQYQRRIFFPDLWTSEEHENWGKDQI
ncbi:MAG TPA: tryptophan 2,3-dioxygenase family protein [Bacteroidia bacterium]|nr:tryptophan 2,3-dioxygenase family protein [Bacteroidia bacterium]